MAEQEAEKLVSLISELIDAKIADSQADSGDSHAGLEEYRIRNSLEEQLTKVLKK